MLDQAFQNIHDTTYSLQEREQIIEDIEKVQQSNKLIHPMILVTAQKIFKLQVFQDNTKPFVKISFLIYQDGIKSFLHKPQNQWKFIQKYENQEEPELTSTYHKNNKLDDIINKLKIEFELNYPYCLNIAWKDQSKVDLEKKILKYTEKIEDDWRNVKELGYQLNWEYQQSQEQRAKLKQLKSFLSEVNESLQDEIKCMEQFKSDHQYQEVNEDNILRIISLNQADEQMCNLQANVFGIRDTYRYVQNRISTSSNVTLEWVCSIVKQLAEQEFNDVLLIKKCQGLLAKK